MRPFLQAAAQALGSLVLAALAVSASSDKPSRPPEVSVAVSFPEKTDAGPPARMAGALLFRSYCVSCHGATARGDGPLADHLRSRPPDLTLIAHRDGGTFDEEKVRRIIDGRTPVKGHGGPDMPVWHDVFRVAEEGEGYGEEKVAGRIQSLVEHLAAVQRTP
jgi:mono/diheme cytochrome c family protein